MRLGRRGGGWGKNGGEGVERRRRVEKGVGNVREREYDGVEGDAYGMRTGL